MEKQNQILFRKLMDRLAVTIFKNAELFFIADHHTP